MTDFRLHWWRTANGRVILGDEISPIVFSHVTGRNVVHSEISDCDGIAIGSIFNPRQASQRKRNHPQLIWGSGALKPRPANYENLSAEIVALRGPKTAGEIEGCPDVPFGDPGLLVPEIWPSSTSRDVPVGIIPHFSMRGSDKDKKLSRAVEGSVTLDLTDADFKKSFRQLSSCKLIVSSSLHGLIFADAYGIPSLFWNESGADNEWKYQDYFGGVGRQGYCSITSSEIIDALRGGTLDELPFSMLPSDQASSAARDLRSALGQSSAMADR